MTLLGADPDHTDAAPCPCGLGAAYPDCCGALHAAFLQRGVLGAPTAEALMRSRFTAFARLGSADPAHDDGVRLARDMVAYLRATWAPETRPAAADLTPSAQEPAPAFTRLAVLAAHADGLSAARVEFVAVGRGPDGRFRLHELSRFRRDADGWRYVDGDVLQH